jgi:hypothetical protein
MARVFSARKHFVAPALSFFPKGGYIISNYIENIYAGRVDMISAKTTGKGNVGCSQRVSGGRLPGALFTLPVAMNYL